jgi:peptidase E
MMKLWFVGGRNPLTGELDEVMHFLSDYIDCETNILVIPFATEELKIDRWFNSAKRSFEDIGVEEINLLDPHSTIQNMQREIRQHHVLYFTGGRPEILMERLSQHDLIQSIKDFTGLMIGVSAGALAFCNDCMITKDEDYPETQVIQGLGLVDFSVEVHYNGTVDEELLPLSDKREIYAIPNGSAFLMSKRRKMVIGEHLNGMKVSKD